MSLNLIIWFLVTWMTFGVKSRPGYQSYQLCGPKLVKTLINLCGEEGFNLLTPPSSNLNNIHSETKGIFLRRRSSGGIVDECCKKECPSTTLALYCKDKNIFYRIKSQAPFGQNYAIIQPVINERKSNASSKKENRKTEVKPKYGLCHCWPTINPIIHKQTGSPMVGTVDEYFLNKSILFGGKEIY